MSAGMPIGVAPPAAPPPLRQIRRRQHDGDPRRWTTADAVLATGLFVTTVAYLAALPRTIASADEGTFLYEAKRILDGQVFYRDIFDLITPGAHYLMAALYWVFGVDIATARLADAVV